MRTPIVGLGHTISFFFLLLFIGLLFNSCKKDLLIDQSFEIDSTDIVLRNSGLVDTSLWQLDYMYNYLSNQHQEGLHEFLFNYGQPQWYSSFQKRSEDKTITITTVPFMRNDSISGVLKMFDANNDSLSVSFFSIDKLDNSLTMDEAGNLNTSEYHMYRGAVQSYVIAANVLNIDIDSKYLEWLKNTTDRISTRSIFTCVYDVECHYILMTFNAPGNPNWIEKGMELSSDSNSITFRHSIECDLFLIECFDVFGDFSYPTFSGSHNSTVDWSINHWLNGSSSNNGINNNTYHTNKSTFLEDWLRDEDLSEDYLDLIYDCAEGVPHPLNPSLTYFVMNESCLKEKLQCYEYDIDIYGNTGTSSFEECVKEQAIKNSECFPQLKQFMLNYGLTQTLTLDEKYALVGPDGVESCDNFEEEAVEILIKILNQNEFFESPSLQEFQNDQDGTFLGRIRKAIELLRAANVGWYADFIEDLIECEEFETVGDLRDTWYMVKDFISEYNQFLICEREQEVSEYMMAIFSPENIGTILCFATFGQNMSPSYRAAFRVRFATHAKAFCSDLSKGFNTINEFKAAHGTAGQGKHWHHIVEKNQIQGSGFNPKMVHHPNNLV